MRCSSCMPNVLPFTSKEPRGYGSGHPNPSVLHLCHMGNTLTVRLSETLQRKLREKSRRTGLPIGVIVRESLEKTLDVESNPLLEYAGVIKGGPPDVSSRKGFSRK